MSELPTHEQVRAGLWQAAKTLAASAEAIQQHAGKVGTSEHAYRQAQAVARREKRNGAGGEKLTVADLNAEVDLVCADQQLEAYLARDHREALREALRARQAVLSALQSLHRGMQAEDELSRFGPNVGAA